MKLDLDKLSKQDVINLISFKEREIVLLKDRLKMHSFDDRKKKAGQYEKQKQLNNSRGVWAKKNIEVGDIIKVTGSRNSSDRKVLSTAHGLIVDAVRWDKHSKQHKLRSYYQSTEHMWNKVTHIFRNDEFVNIKDLIGLT
jgi:hypothetical protein